MATRLSELEEGDMRSILKFKGGTFIKEYLASSYTQATNSFPNPQQLRFQSIIENLHRFSE